MFYIVSIRADHDDYAVYGVGRRGPFGTPLLFRGTLSECLTFRRKSS